MAARNHDVDGVRSTATLCRGPTAGANGPLPAAGSPLGQRGSLRADPAVVDQLVFDSYVHSQLHDWMHVRQFRDELLADVARRGFDQFEAALTRAWGGGRPDPFAAFDRVGKAYLEFANREPAYYSAMFEAGVPPDASPELRAAGERAFAVLRGATEELVAAMPAGSRPPVLMMALHIWALSHGVASLFGRGDAARRALPIAPDELLEAAVLIYLRGLGLPDAPPAADQRTP